MFVNDINVNTLDYTGSLLADPLAENNTTGANSVNNAIIDLSTSVAGMNENLAALANLIAVDAISGNNDISNNTGNATAETGDVSGTLVTDNIVNSNFLNIIATGTDNPIVALNDTTGFASSNDAVVSVSAVVAVENVNLAEIANDLYAMLSSGGNTVWGNTGNASLDTGSVTGETVVANDVNRNSTVITSDGTPEIMASNSTTGANSVNGAAAMASIVVVTENANASEISNTVATTTLSGGNDVSNNTGTADVSTGDASNSVAVDNAGSTNETEIDLGTGGAMVVASNDTTGSGSTNQTDASLNVAVVSSNTNESTISNDVDVSSCTGCNTVSNNGGGGTSSLTTGDASSDVAISNNVNVNTTAITTGGGADVSASNSTTGAGSVNGSAATVTDTVVVSNVNEAVIVNNVTSDSLSGGNDVSGNTGGGSVSTGSASATFGVSNTGNANSTTVEQ